MNYFIKGVIAVVLISILESCCDLNIRGSYLEINFENFIENEILDITVIKKESNDSLNIDFNKISKNSIEILIDEATYDYDLYILDSNSSVIDSIIGIETIIINDSSNCTDGDYEYEYKFKYKGIESTYSHKHKIDIVK